MYHLLVLRFHQGREIRKGLGAGARPLVGQSAATETLDEVQPDFSGDQG